MKFNALWLPVLLGLSLGGISVACAQATPQLAQRMGTVAFQRAGLDKLKPAELAYLEQWLGAHAAELAASVPASQVASARVVASKPSADLAAQPQQVTSKANRGNDRAVTSRLAGRFAGWQRGTVLVLDNGQQWRVVDNSTLVPRQPLDSPEVVVRPAMLGSWILKVQGYNTSARVTPAN